MTSKLSAPNTLYVPNQFENMPIQQMGKFDGSYSVDISNAAYHSDRTAVSCSQLKVLLRSPAHFKKSLLTSFGSTLGQDIGTAVHTAVLEPTLFANSVSVWRGGVQKGIIWEKFKESNPNKIIFRPHDYDHVLRMRDAIFNYTLPNCMDSTLGELLGAGESEKTIFWTDKETGILCKVRIDNLLAPTIIFDVKTCGDCRPAEFMKNQAFKLNYDLQAAIYHSGVLAYTGKSLPFCFITVEDDAPHGVWLHETGPGSQFFENGMKKFRYALRTLAKARQTDVWPIYENSYTALDAIPSYAIFKAPDDL
jgi:hypothetical protein